MTNLLSDPIFQALFNSPVPRIIVRADAPVFTIFLNNDAHAVTTNLVGRDISGKSVWEVFDPQESGGNGGELLMAALNEAQQKNQTVLMPPFRYDITAKVQDEIDEKWWQLEIMPIGGINGKPEYLLATTYDITPQVLKEREIEQGQVRERQLFQEVARRNEALLTLNEELAQTNEELEASREDLQQLNESLEDIVASRTRELAASEAKFRTLVEQSPVAIALLQGEGFVIDAVNPEMLRIWGKEANVVGKPILQALPEMEGQPYPQVLREVFETGAPFYSNESEVYLLRNNELKSGFFNFINYPIKNEQGVTENIIVVANEVTDQVIAKRRTEHSEKRLHTLIMNAHYPLMILQGEEWVVEIANQQIANLWSKPLSEITGRKLLDILPEVADQPFPALLRKVYETGAAYGQSEEVFYLQTPEGVQIKYISFFYDPILDDERRVNAIIVSANDISEHVQSRKELERVYEQASLSKKAAQLGTFDMDLLAGTMEWDARCRELFGISHQNPVSYDNDFLPGLHEEDKERISEIISKLFDKNISDGNYDVEYRTVGVEDGKIRWVRAKGKVFFDQADQPVRFIGSVLDITDRKLDEQRKNDFIGMVSHELKTPLTSLKANIQVLNRRARKMEDVFFTDALVQAEKQINKMNTMILGFLNLSRFESGKLNLNLQVADLNDIIGQEIGEISFNHEITHISFVGKAPIPLRVDVNKIGLVISNLLSNSIKYSAPGTPIEVASQILEDQVVVCVKDQGRGIPTAELSKLFDRYYRANDVEKNYISGFGIGLYLCYEIIQLHSGKIWAESELGKGSTFFFSLPLSN